MATETVSPTLQQVFGYGHIPKFKGALGTIPVASIDRLLGVEIELEQVTIDHHPESFNPTADGSLKINGMEFVSVPLALGFLEVELGKMFAGIKKAVPSKRCSIHIHMDVRDFTTEELHKFILLYIIFEKAFFRFSGNRWTSNYCTPLFFNPEIVTDFLGLPFRKWFKYSAFNLAPIYGDKNQGSSKHGTIEFRHMEGTMDIQRIVQWSNLIVSLGESAKGFELKDLLEHIRVMNTTSGYYWLSEKVFGQWSHFITNTPKFKEDIESCITMAKSVAFANDGTPRVFNFKQPTPNEEKKVPLNKNDLIKMGYAAAGGKWHMPDGGKTIVHEKALKAWQIALVGHAVPPPQFANFAGAPAGWQDLIMPDTIQQPDEDEEEDF